MDFLAAMRVFVRVAERGSMSAAARDLGLGQPAVSERIERLEAHLGVRLLRRNTRAISLTDAGAGFYERCKTAIDAADAALHAARADSPLRGRVRIAAPHGLGETLLPPLLLRLRRDCPQLRIELVLNDRLVDPVTEGVDVSLRLGGPGEGHYVARKLGHVRRVLAASPEYLQRHGAPAAPADLLRHPFARVSGLFNDGRLILRDKHGRTATAAVDTVLSVSHWRPLHALLLGGAGIGVLQEPVCREDLASGRLQRVLPDHQVPGFDLHALYSPEKPLPQRVRTVLALLEKALPRQL